MTFKFRIGPLRISLFEKPEPVRPTFTFRRGYNLKTWKGRHDLVEQTQQLYASDFFQKWMAVLHAEIPRGYAHDPGQQLGRMNGWMEALHTMEQMAVPDDLATPEPEATYGAKDDPIFEVDPNNQQKNNHA